MKNVYTKVVTLLFAIGIFSLITSCEKGDPPPEIAFRTAQGYTSSNAAVARKTEVKMGIVAKKSGDRDYLTKFTIKRSRNSGEDLIVVSQNLTGVDHDEFTYDYVITTDDASSIDKYTFTVTTNDGLSSNVSLTLDVQ